MTRFVRSGRDALKGLPGGGTLAELGRRRTQREMRDNSGVLRWVRPARLPCCESTLYAVASVECTHCSLPIEEQIRGRACTRVHGACYACVHTCTYCVFI